jgi:DNA-binding transcriptional LysR family regulator
LGIPASSVGRKLAELEELLGVQLIHRSTRSARISNEGRFYLEQFAPLIQELERAQRFLNESEREPEGILKIAAPFSYGIWKLEPVLTQFLINHPKVSVQLSLKNEYQDIVAEGYDLAISLGPLKSSTLIAKKIDAVAYRCVAGKTYLEKHETLREPQDLAKHRCIALARKVAPLDWVLNSPAGDCSVRITPCFAVNDPIYALQMAKKGCGIAYLPDFLVAEDIESGDLVDVLAGWKARSRDVYAVYHHKHLMPLSLSLLLKSLEKI